MEIEILSALEHGPVQYCELVNRFKGGRLNAADDAVRRLVAQKFVWHPPAQSIESSNLSLTASGVFLLYQMRLQATMAGSVSTVADVTRKEAEAARTDAMWSRALAIAALIVSVVSIVVSVIF